MKRVAKTGMPSTSDGASARPKKLAGVKPSTDSAPSNARSPSESSHTYAATQIATRSQVTNGVWLTGLSSEIGIIGGLPAFRLA